MTETLEKEPRDGLAWWSRHSTNEPRYSTRAEKVTTPVTQNTAWVYLCIRQAPHGFLDSHAFVSGSTQLSAQLVTVPSSVSFLLSSSLRGQAL